MSENAVETGTTRAPVFAFERGDRVLVLAHLGVAFIALLLGAAAGMLQGLQRTGYIKWPDAVGYYQLLTLHGVALALIFTTLFIIGFLLAGTAKTLGGRLHTVDRVWAWIGWIMMVVGTAMGTVSILNNSATVLYTFYAPLKASPWFYVAMALVVVGSWLGGVAIFTAYARWRRQHRGQVSPLFAYMSVATMILWIIATLGVAIEVLFQLIPMAFGWVPRVNVELSRTLFWYFGHPLVYFWLLPAYIYWYVNIPQIIKGKLFSDSLPRLTFVLFILYSIPVGFHHQFNEPGIANGWKILAAALTLTVVVPSLMTVFAMFATFEMAGRAQGATGRFAWLRKLPWKDVRFFAPFLGMVMFIPGGAGGVVNASYQLNQVIHNTLWVTGHFHMTLSSAVTLTFFGIAYWLVPALTNRKLTWRVNNLGIFQAWLWFIGMLLNAIPMHIVGLLGEPRRTAFTTYNDNPVVQPWLPYWPVMGMSGIFLFLSIMLFLGAMIYLWWFAPRLDTPAEFPIGEVKDKSHPTPMILERWPLWIALTGVLVLIVYTVPLVDMIQTPPPSSPPIRSW
ncbi:b(o/a)3-type cytochrome-c oxidase subunit 1 [Kyrpidia spormannii]|uniref:Cytochrome c oxidase subunit 1 n=1 Tax=Kyrpidia spormannii TaxID=2055160 RepID=A0ACA8Z5C3_9BACL|nr:b(o/a)3-type cytochrome-c oxidase subunit 1 [Kyrpidia spormannii]CAB3389204.1 Cytochrome c oxidase subunit 1 [Kyrpidia spormannii]